MIAFLDPWQADASIHNRIGSPRPTSREHDHRRGNRGWVSHPVRQQTRPIETCRETDTLLPSLSRATRVI
jgi:hypothetical protein